MHLSVNTLHLLTLFISLRYFVYFQLYTVCLIIFLRVDYIIIYYIVCILFTILFTILVDILFTIYY